MRPPQTSRRNDGRGLGAGPEAIGRRVARRQQAPIALFLPGITTFLGRSWFGDAVLRDKDLDLIGVGRFSRCEAGMHGRVAGHAISYVGEVNTRYATTQITQSIIDLSCVS